MAITFKYLGGGFFPGIPMRDLTDEDELTPEQKATLAEHVKLESGRIYEAAEEAKTEPATPATTKKGV